MKLKKLLEEIKPPKGKGIIIFDIDDTLVKGAGVQIYKRKAGEKEKALTPEQFAKEDVKKERANGVIYDYRDFDNPKKMYNSIIKGIPFIKNLKMLDSYMRANWDIGFLTARGAETANKQAIKEWLKYRNKNGDLVPIPEERIKYFIALSDKKRIKELKNRVKASGDFDAKGIYLSDIQKKYDIVKFVDDDMKNILSARKVLPKKNVIKV